MRKKEKMGVSGKWKLEKKQNKKTKGVGEKRKRKRYHGRQAKWKDKRRTRNKIEKIINERKGKKLIKEQ